MIDMDCREKKANLGITNVLIEKTGQDNTKLNQSIINFLAMIIFLDGRTMSSDPMNSSGNK